MQPAYRKVEFSHRPLNNRLAKRSKSPVEIIRTGNPNAVEAFYQSPSVGDKPTKRSIVMDWDRIEGNWKQFSGKVKEKWGQLTDDDLSKINGRRDQLEGIIQQRYGYAKDQARDEVDRWSNTL